MTTPTSEDIANADRRRRFVLAASLLGAPPHRREHVLRALLSDPGRVLRFLLLLLADHTAGAFAALTGPSADPDAGAAALGAFEEPLCESLLKALARDPARIDAVADVVRDLEQTADGRALLPPGLDALWPAVWAARQRTRDGMGEA